jgi:hypothetical protein
MGHRVAIADDFDVRRNSGDDYFATKLGQGGPKPQIPAGAGHQQRQYQTG